MIKFFRTIRQKLLTENKFRKYVIYAIGEIVLVVIGILIALQINNWNEQRKEAINEQIILKRLTKEFTSNRLQLLQKIESRNDINKKCSRLLTFFSYPEKADKDSIFEYLGSIVPTTFDPIQNDLVSSGRINILKNEALKQLLINWSTDVIQLQEVEQMFLRFYQTFIDYNIEIGVQRDLGHSFWQKISSSSFLENKAVKNPIPGNSRISKVSKEVLLSDKKLEGIITWSLNLNQSSNEESQTLLNRIDFILKMLDSETNK